MNRNHKQRCSAWRILPVLLLSALTVQAETGLYDVEVIVFSNAAAGSDSEVDSQPGSGFSPARGSSSASMFTELPANEYRLNNIRGGLASARAYRVLFHRAWRQPAYDRGSAVDYPIRTLSDNGRDSVEGGITLIKERYLHLDVDLLMRARSASPGLYSDGPVYRLNEKRRIRSNELHYFDHPRFGVIARVTPYVSAEDAATPEPAMEGVPDDTAGGGLEEEPVPADDQLTR